MNLLIRVMAQAVDLFVGLLSIFVTFVYILPFFSGIISDMWISVIFGIVIIIAVNLGLQYPFLKNHQTIGKAFFSLELVSTDPQRPLTVSIILQRELLCKLMSCFFICMPMLAGRPGGHEIASATEVVRKTKVIKKKRGGCRV